MINKSRNIDLELYKLLNTPKINQEIFHIGCIPLIRNGKKPEKEFTDFIKKLSVFMEYDINTDFVWSKMAEDESKQKMFEEKMGTVRNGILKYLLDHNAITNIDYSNLSSKPVKSMI